MKREYILVTLFFAITAAIFYLFYRLIIPFFVPICWAGIFVIVFFPLYERILKRVKSSALAAVIMCLLIIVLIIGPLSYLLVNLVSEAVLAINEINLMVESGELEKLLAVGLPWLEAAQKRLAAYYDLNSINVDNLVRQAVEYLSQAVLERTKNIITNTTRIVFYFFLMVFTMYYFFKDGERLVDKVKRLMPLTHEQTNLTFRQLRDVIYATMYGGVTVALVQGTLGGIMFAAMGINSPVFWGAIMTFLSILPFVGAFIVYVPAGIIMILAGSYFKGIFILAFGTLVISQVDNVLRPYLISGRTAMHPLLLFFTILGGIYLFSLLGLVLGPLIAAIFITLLKIFELRLHPETDSALTVEKEP